LGDFQEKKTTPKFKNQVHLNPTLQHMIPDLNHMILGQGTTLYYYYYLGSFNTNYIIFKNVENFQKLIFFPKKPKKNCERKS
jgi:hypothetical protein